MLSLVSPSTPTTVRQFLGRVGGPLFFVPKVGGATVMKLPLLPPTTDEHAEDEDAEEAEELGRSPPPTPPTPTPPQGEEAWLLTMDTPPREAGKVPELKPSSEEGRGWWAGSRGESERPRLEVTELDSQEVFSRELGDTPPEEELTRRGGAATPTGV